MYKVIKKAQWIKSKEDFNGVCPTFFKTITIDGNIEKADVSVTATGVYELYVNGARISNYVLAPGWTNYEKRLQYQTYDVIKYLKQGENLIEITVGSGWYLSRIRMGKDKRIYVPSPCVIADIELVINGKEKNIYSDLSWCAKQSKILHSDIYNGEIFDANFEGIICETEKIVANKAVLIPQEGEIICEHEHLRPVDEFITPKGERVIDFGQEITGYVEFSGFANKGDIVSLSFAEVMDNQGNFYNENYRGAECIYKYICKDGEQSYKPHTTFYGFRYIRVDSAPDNTPAESFTAIVVCSDIKKTGTLKTDNKYVDKLFRNIEWGQRGNFLDVPTDCPQRDERLGWTGDAQVFIKTAAYQYDVKKFFAKWLDDMASEQRNDGLIPKIIPDVYCDSVNGHNTSPAWGDAAVICPWTIYETYGDKELLKKHYPMMKKWISYVDSVTDDEDLWTGYESYGDWLGIDAPKGSYIGLSDKDFVASAYYTYTLSLMKKAAKEINSPDYELYEYKYEKSRRAFINRFSECKTQTEYALALRFNLTEKKEEYARRLAELIHQNGDCLTTGFAGTPHLLFALSENGQTDTAYKLLLQDKYPSWLYSVKNGATTIWEHWDGIKEDGTFWSADMNSFNHYAYGAIAEWVYSVAAGIKINEKGLIINPHPSKELGSLTADFESRFGRVVSSWKYEGDKAVINIEIPVDCPVIINGKEQYCQKGSYTFTV